MPKALIGDDTLETYCGMKVIFWRIDGLFPPPFLYTDEWLTSRAAS